MHALQHSFNFGLTIPSVIFLAISLSVLGCVRHVAGDPVNVMTTLSGYKFCKFGDKSDSGTTLGCATMLDQAHRLDALRKRFPKANIDELKKIMMSEDEAKEAQLMDEMKKTAIENKANAEMAMLAKKEQLKKLKESGWWKAQSESDIYRIARDKNIYPVVIMAIEENPDYSAFVGVVMDSIISVRSDSIMAKLLMANHTHKTATALLVDSPDPKVIDISDPALIATVDGLKRAGVNGPYYEAYSSVFLNCNTGMMLWYSGPGKFTPPEFARPHYVADEGERKIAEIVCLLAK